MVHLCIIVFALEDVVMEVSNFSFTKLRFKGDHTIKANTEEKSDSWNKNIAAQNFYELHIESLWFQHVY